MPNYFLENNGQSQLLDKTNGKKIVAKQETACMRLNCLLVTKK